MSIDKTLAGVQPGGRVRLGDAPWPEIDAILADAYSAGAEGLPFEGIARRAAVRKAVAALSAQPSPGGQGDAPTAEMIEAAIGAFFKGQQWSSIGDKAAVETKMRGTLEAALAARQPVGEPVGYLYDWTHSSALGRGDEEFTSFTTDIEVARSSKGGINIRPVYAAPTAQADQEYLESLDRALEGVIDERDQYHEMADDLAGHIAAITGVDIGEHSSANCPWQNAIEAAEEYKTAQAVDLGQFREHVARSRHMLMQGVVGLKGADREDIWKCINDADRLLALIDSQAVGNGN